ARAADGGASALACACVAAVVEVRRAAADVLVSFVGGGAGVDLDSSPARRSSDLAAQRRAGVEVVRAAEELEGRAGVDAEVAAAGAARPEAQCAGLDLDLMRRQSGVGVVERQADESLAAGDRLAQRAAGQDVDVAG